MPHYAAGGLVTYLVMQTEPGRIPAPAPLTVPAAVTDLLSRHGGAVLSDSDCVDSVCAAFLSAPQAAAAACAIRERLGADPGGQSLSARLRMAIHAGPDQSGHPALNHALHLAAVAHGGQTLLSADTAALVEHSLPAGAVVEQLGSHRLRDLRTVERIAQICHAAEPFPPLLTLNAIPNNLPVQVTSFIGRRREMAELKRHLGASRLVTLTGTGGNGKTRMALQVAADLADRFPDGVWLVDLTSLADGALVAQAAASALKVREEAGRPLIETLCAQLGNRQLLILLDNCEHVITSCARLASTLLFECPHVQMLATSREPLGIAGETAWAMPTLSLPEDPGDLGALERCEAVRLFVERAQAASPSFALTAQNAGALVTVCSRLDGVPLAIELAAARTRVLSVEQIAERLDDRLRLLTSGNRTVLPRHQTLRAAIDWSYELLTDEERILWRRLAVFAGGFSLEAAEAVCSASEIDPFDVLDLLSHLVDKSLVLAEEWRGEKRYRLLDTMRQYGWERLREAGEEERLRRAHRDWYVAFAERAEGELMRPDQARWLDLIAWEHDNLRQTLRWSMETGSRIAARRLCGALWRFWYVRGYITENAERMARLTEGEESDGDREILAKVLNGTGAFAFYVGDLARAVDCCSRSLSILRECGDRLEVARVLNNLGVATRTQGRWDEARAYLEEALSINRSVGARPLEAWNLNNLGSIYYSLGELTRARQCHEESLAIQRQLGDEAGVAMSNDYLGYCALREGDNRMARTHFETALAILRSLGDKRGTASALGGLGDVACFSGEHATARALHKESMLMRQGLGDQMGLVRSLETLAWVAAAEGAYEVALQVAGGADALRRQIGAPLAPVWAHEAERRLGPARQALGERAAEALEAGARLSVEALMELACADREPEPVKARAAEPGHDNLTARELEILRLAARGMTAREIGQQLYLSPRTVEKHEENIRTKLDLPNRAALVAWGARKGLVDE